MIEETVGRGIIGHVKYVGRDEDGNINYFREHSVEFGEHNTVCDLTNELNKFHMVNTFSTKYCKLIKHLI